MAASHSGEFGYCKMKSPNRPPPGPDALLLDAQWQCLVRGRQSYMWYQIPQVVACSSFVYAVFSLKNKLINDYLFK